jgi:hypothetical protein
MEACRPTGSVYAPDTVEENDQKPVKGVSQNKATLDAFRAYCEENPSQRFWQALRNWSGAKFILETNFAPFEFGKDNGWMKDTFHREGREK